MSKPIGIDLGTTYSAIACWKDSGLVVGPDCYHFPLEEKYFIASKIFISDLNNRDNNVRYGKGAIQYSTTDPDRFYSAFKREMDKNEPIERKNGKITPVELSSMLLNFMFKNAVIPVEGVDFIPEGVAVSVPYYFTERPIKNTRTALSNSLQALFAENLAYDESINLKTVPEPIAAGLDYAFSFLDSIEQQNILIFDLGGGTFDVTAYELKNSLIDKKLEFTVLATDGDAHLGGEDFDASIRRYILDKNNINEVKEREDQYKVDYAQLYKETTEAKCVLSAVDSTTIVINPFYGQPLLEFTITKQDIERILRGEAGSKIDYISKIEDIVDRCLFKAGINSRMVDRVVLVGGSSNIPCIRQMLEQKFGADKMYQSPRPSETVARGACIWATYLIDKANTENPDYHRHLNYWNEIIIKPKTPHNLGVMTANGLDTIIYSNRFTPISGTRVYCPSRLSDDGATASLDPLVVKQGQDIIGTIPIPTIYSHGRSKKDMLISVTLLAEPNNNVKVKINVPKGNEDGTDLHTEGEIQIS